MSATQQLPEPQPGSRPDPVADLFVDSPSARRGRSDAEPGVLLDRVLHRFRSRCCARLRLALDKVDEDLFDLAEATSDQHAQTAYFGDLRMLRRARARLPAVFDSALAEGLERPVEADGGPHPESPEVGWLAPLIAVAEWAELDCHVPLKALRRRITMLVDDPARLGPAQVLRSLERAAAPLVLEPPAQLRFLQHVEGCLFIDLHAGYQEADDRLAEVVELPVDDPPSRPRIELSVPAPSAEPPGARQPRRMDTRSGLAATERGQYRRYVEHLYRSVLQESELSDPARQLVERSKGPMLRRLLTPGTRRTFPSGPRILLTRLAHIIGRRVTTTDFADRFFGKMRPWFERLAGDSTTARASFQDLLRELDALTCSMDEAMTDAPLSPARHRSRIDDARSIAEAEIDRRLARHDVPDSIESLISVAWVNVLVLDYLRRGPASSDWRSSLACLDDLIWTSEPKRSAADVARLQSMLPALSRDLRAALEKVAFDEPDIEEVFERLRELYKSRMDERYRDKLHMPTARAASPLRQPERLSPARLQPEGVAAVDGPDERPTLERAEPAAAEGPDAPKRENAYVRSRIEALTAGSWLEFASSEGGRIRAKLSWVSPISKNYLFVSDAGTKLADKSLDELTEEFARGETVLLDATPVFGASKP